MRDALGVSFFLACTYTGAIFFTVAVAWSFWDAIGFFVGLALVFLLTWRLFYIIAAEMTE